MYLIIFSNIHYNILNILKIFNALIFLYHYYLLYHILNNILPSFNCGFNSDITRFPLGDRRNFVLQESMTDFELILYENETEEISRQIVLSQHNWKMLNSIIDKISECFDEICKNKEAEMSFHLGDGIYVSLDSPYRVVHIRKYYLSKENLFLPTTTGVAMRCDEFRDLKSVMQLINPDLKLDVTI